jgi:hypothetical protein
LGALALSLCDVRDLAAAEGLEAIYFNPTSRVISFAPSGGEADSSFTRLNVYYTTGMHRSPAPGEDSAQREP